MHVDARIHTDGYRDETDLHGLQITNAPASGGRICYWGWGSVGERDTGVEPAPTPWKGVVLPLY